MDFELLKGLWKLKETDREGWKYVGIKRPESVADHSFFVALLTLILPLPPGIDRNRMLRMAIVHDLAEAFTGDVVWRRDGKEFNMGLKRRKDEEEMRVIREISEKLENPEILELFVEYEERKTMEAKLLKEIDKLEMAIQARLYERMADTSEFIRDAKTVVKTKELREIIERI